MGSTAFVADGQVRLRRRLLGRVEQRARAGLGRTDCSFGPRVGIARGGAPGSACVSGWKRGQRVAARGAGERAAEGQAIRAIGCRMGGPGHVHQERPELGEAVRCSMDRRGHRWLPIEAQSRRSDCRGHGHPRPVDTGGSCRWAFGHRLLLGLVQQCRSPGDCRCVQPHPAGFGGRPTRFHLGLMHSDAMLRISGRAFWLAQCKVHRASRLGPS